MQTSLAPLQEQFTSHGQQRRVALLGMWVFLATEVLFFGALLVAYTSYRVWYPAGFASGSHHLDVALGTLNTAILIVSSFCMAVAITATRELNRRAAIIFLLLTALLGLSFLGIKGYEWYDAIRHGLWPGYPENPGQPHGLHLFFSFYFVMTGLHGLHLIIALVAVSIFVAGYVRQTNFVPNQNSITVLGLYWHFVDIVWIFLYPMLYLLQRYAA